MRRRWVSRYAFAEILVNSQHNNFRPTAFLFWKTWLELFGAGQPSAFSLFNLLAHATNAFMLGFVLLRFYSSPVLAWSAASVFLVFPPANEALFWMSGGHDVYGMTFLLLAALAASLGLKNQTQIWSLAPMAVLTFAGTLAAMLSKETAYVAFPFVASLALLNHNERGSLHWKVWLSWFIALNAAVAVFFLLRGQVIPISQSAYGDPREFYARAELFKNFLENFRALFTFGYFGSSQWIAWACKFGGLIAAACLFLSFADSRHRLGAFAIATTLGLALAATAFTRVGLGAASGGRLLYMSAMISSILIGTGIAWLVNNDWRRQKTLPGLKYFRNLGMVIIALLIGLELISLNSFTYRFRESTSIAKNVMAQLSHLKENSFVYVRNLPHNLVNGPFVLKCYAPGMYMKLTEGRSPAFRCDKVSLDFDGIHYFESTPRQPDKFSDYKNARSGERQLELVFLS